MNKKIIVVLGPGRSGTSLLMQVLNDLGMNISNTLIEPSVANPAGPYEDAEIFNLQSKLLRDLHTSATIPMPDDWIQNKQCQHTIDELKKIIQNHMNMSLRIFGFKDPRTSVLIPLWTHIFNSLKVVPIYILAVRNPKSMIDSYVTQYNKPTQIAESVWLVRTVQSLYHTNADCFIVHYEDWFSRAKLLIQDLLVFTGLNKSFNGNILDIIDRNINKNLNRANKDTYAIQNPFIEELYSVLATCTGSSFDRKRLMNVVIECRQAMDGFKWWYQSAHQANKKIAEMQSQIKHLKTEANKVKDLETLICTLDQENLRKQLLYKQVKKLEQQLEQFMALSLNS